MSLNGIENWMNLLSWLVTGIIWNFFLLIPIVLMLKFSWVSESNAFMEKGNPFLIFLAFSLHIVHLSCFGYHIASYFNKRKFYNKFYFIQYSCLHADDA